MREVLFYRWRISDARRPGKCTTTGHRLTAEEAQRLHPSAVPVGEPERRWVPDGPDEFAFTGAFQHQRCIDTSNHQGEQSTMTESAEHYRRALERILETLHICDLPTSAILAQMVGIAEEALGVPESERIKFRPDPSEPKMP